MGKEAPIVNCDLNAPAKNVRGDDIQVNRCRGADAQHNPVDGSVVESNGKFYCTTSNCTSCNHSK